MESWFKTLKYSVSYPGKFETLKDAREWFAIFVHQYNTCHSHSGLHFITPKQVREGSYKKIVKKRNKTMVAAKKRNPHRWSRAAKQLPEEHVVHLNPSADTRILLKTKKERVPA
ncbi:MAG: integrase core domain-containing protein [Spirochaetales bacterium]|nr:integrase core domain-containing protein [Spirochaetales bacterium]